jgi:hypothetical protein
MPSCEAASMNKGEQKVHYGFKITGGIKTMIAAPIHNAKAGRLYYGFVRQMPGRTNRS